MEEKDIRYFFESEQAKSERTIKRLILSLLVSIILIFACNALWLYAWMQFEYVGEEVTVDGTDGIATYMGGGGTITNGTSDNT